jgi:hypothetical protein
MSDSFRFNLTNSFHQPGAKTSFTPIHRESCRLFRNTVIHKLFSDETAFSVGGDQCQCERTKYISTEFENLSSKQRNWDFECFIIVFQYYIYK